MIFDTLKEKIYEKNENHYGLGGGGTQTLVFRPLKTTFYVFLPLIGIFALRTAWCTYYIQ